jgi:hypothetical protein
MKNKIIILLLLVANIACLAYLLMLGWNNSLLMDDLAFIKAVEQKGIFGWIHSMYFNWQGRFGMFFISGLLFSLAMKFSNLVLLTIIQLILGYISVFCLLKYCFQKASKWVTLLVSVTVFNLSILGLLDFSTFYWVCASAYITIISFTILLIVVIVNDKLNGFIAIPLIIVLSFLVGGSAETYAPMVMLVLGILFLFKLKQSGFKLFFDNIRNRRLLLSLVLLFIFFIMMILAPGNKVRLESETGMNYITDFSLIVRTLQMMMHLILIIIPKSIYYILAFPLFCWLGYSFGYPYKENLSLHKYGSFKMFFISVVALLLFLVIGILPGVLLFHGFAPLRSLTYVSFVLVVFFAFWGVVTGINLRDATTTSHVINTGMIIMGLLFTGISICRFSNDYAVSVEHKKEINSLFEKLVNLEKQHFRGIVKVKITDRERMSSSYIKFYNFLMSYYKPMKMVTHSPYGSDFPYVNYYLTTDPNHWENQIIRDYLNLNFDIVGDVEPYADEKNK